MDTNTSDNRNLPSLSIALLETEDRLLKAETSINPDPASQITLTFMRLPSRETEHPGLKPVISAA